MHRSSNTSLLHCNEKVHRDTRRENVLTPLHWPEAISTSDAADLAKRAATTIRSRVYVHDLGQNVETTLYIGANAPATGDLLANFAPWFRVNGWAPENGGA